MICELSLAKAGEKIMTNAAVSSTAMMQYRTASLLIFPDGYILVIKDVSKRRSGPDYLLVLMPINEFLLSDLILSSQAIRTENRWIIEL